MQKPEINKTYADLTPEEKAGLESHAGKKIVGRAKNAGYEIMFMDDGSEIVRGPDGKFTDWPE